MKKNTVKKLLIASALALSVATGEKVNAILPDEVKIVEVTEERKDI